MPLALRTGKLAVEHQGQRLGVLSVRPGVVFGRAAGRMCGALAKAVSRFPVTPVVGGGRQVLFLAHEQDLSRLILRLCLGAPLETKTPVIAASSTPRTLREILAVLAEAQGHKRLFIPVPWRTVWAALKLTESVGLRPRFRSDSVISLVNQEPKPSFEETYRLGVNFRELTLESLQE